MGLLRLKVNDWARFPDEQLARVFVASGDELPYAGRTFRSGDQLIVERRDDTSGCLWAPWSHGPLQDGPLQDGPVEGGPVEGGPEERGRQIGEWLIGTSTLMEREAPYLLEVELARGCVFRLRNQLASWVQLGLESTAELDAFVAEATRLFCRAATRQADPAAAAGMAAEAIATAAEGSLLLASVYAQQAMAVRQAATPKLPTLLGLGLNGDPPEATDGPITEAFSSVAVRCAWNAVEASEGRRRWKRIDNHIAWANKSGLRVCGGPLLEFSDHSVPDWAYLWEGDFEALATLMVTHVETVVRRYRGRVQLWNVASRVNRGRALGLSDEQRLQLVARAVRVVREADPKAPAVVTFDQPWGEYLINDPSDLAPIDFADALERADLGIAGFGLELNLGFRPDGATPRNPLDLSRLLDYWSLRLELPLMLQLTAPSGDAPDGLARNQGGVCSAGTPPGADINAAFQADWVAQTLPMLLAKNCVQVVMWNTHRDDQPHRYPHSGLVDAEGKAKPALEVLRGLRVAHLV